MIYIDILANKNVDRKWGIPVTVYAHLLLSLLFSVKHMVCHVPHVPRIATLGTILAEAFFKVNNEIRPILVTHLLVNE